MPLIGFRSESIDPFAICACCFSGFPNRALMNREAECLTRLTQARSDMIQLRFERSPRLVAHRYDISNRGLVSC
jgi:hypothetical protein